MTVSEWSAHFDGLTCLDAMENVGPEHWPAAVAGFAHVLKPLAPAYITVEVPDLAESGDLSATVAADGAPLVAGESDDGIGYHYYPRRDDVMRWLRSVGFDHSGEDEADDYLASARHEDGLTPRIAPSRTRVMSRLVAWHPFTEPRRRGATVAALGDPLATSGRHRPWRRPAPAATSEPVVCLRRPGRCAGAGSQAPAAAPDAIDLDEPSRNLAPGRVVRPVGGSTAQVG